MRGQETDHVISGPMRGLTLLLFQIMAKWGEGDPRWIVEERPDATNVNNWHWTERNADKWSKQKIKVDLKQYLWSRRRETLTLLMCADNSIMSKLIKNIKSNLEHLPVFKALCRADPRVQSGTTLTSLLIVLEIWYSRSIQS